MDLDINVGNSGVVACNGILLDEVVTFSGNNSYAILFESFSPITDFRLMLSFRNSIRNKADCNGLFIYIGSADVSDYLALNLDRGRVS